LFAPLTFDWTYEHPLLMLAAAFCIGGTTLLPVMRSLWSDRPSARRIAMYGGVTLVIIANVAANLGLDGHPVVRLVMIGMLSAAALAALGNRALFTAAVGALMLFSGGLGKLALSIEHGRMTRSFFGVDTIGDTADHARVLMHGTTVHGIQLRGTPERERQVVSYYGPSSGMGIAMRNVPSLFGPAARIDVVGLGAGTLACYAKPGQAWRFYEIDPVVVEIARTSFTFLSRCTPSAPIEVGDARLTLAQRPPASADMLIIDAFSSDTVPMHLLTLEAFDNYHRHLAANGLLMFHISNRFLDMEPVLAEAALQGWNARIRYDDPPLVDRERYFTHSLWVAMSPSTDTIARIERAAPAGTWRRLKRRENGQAWTDDFATILPIIKWRPDIR